MDLKGCWPDENVSAGVSLRASAGAPCESRDARCLLDPYVFGVVSGKVKAVSESALSWAWASVRTTGGLKYYVRVPTYEPGVAPGPEPGY